MVFNRKIFIAITAAFVLGGILVGWYLVTLSRFVTPLAKNGAPTPDPILQTVKDTSSLQQYPPSEYFPLTTTPKFNDDLKLSANAYAAMDVDTRDLLLARDLTAERPIASVAKIMTAVTALEQYVSGSQLLVSRTAADTGEAYMGLTAGEQLSVEDLLYGLLLPSGNDAAEALAHGIRPGEPIDAADLVKRRRDQFVYQMNSTAQKLHLSDTYFVNPSGLDERLRQLSSFSTPLDLLALSNYALRNKTFATIVATQRQLIPYEEGKHKAFFLENILQLNGTLPGIKGIKPGQTEFAGETLASYLENNDRRIILILLDSKATRDDAIKAYEFLLGQNRLE